MAQRTISSATCSKITQLKQVVRNSGSYCSTRVFLVAATECVAARAQAFVGANDAHVIPHKQAQFMPVVLDDHFLITASRYLASSQMGTEGQRDVLCFSARLWRRPGINHTFEQRV